MQDVRLHEAIQMGGDLDEAWGAHLAGMGNRGQLGCRGCYTCHRGPFSFGPTCRDARSWRMAAFLSAQGLCRRHPPTAFRIEPLIQREDSTALQPGTSRLFKSCSLGLQVCFRSEERISVLHAPGTCMVRGNLPIWPNRVFQWSAEHGSLVSFEAFQTLVVT